MVLQREHSAQVPLGAIASEFSLSEAHLVELLRIFHTKSSRANKGNNVEFMKRSLRTLRERDTTFHYSLQQQQVTLLVRALVEGGHIALREYPKVREKPKMDGRRFLTEQKVYAIIAGNQQLFLDTIRREGGLDEGFRSFAESYNDTYPREYFPMKWKSLSNSVKDKIKDLLSFGKGNIRALDTAGLRFSPREEILTHQIFREFIIYVVQRARKSGTYDFREIMRSALSFWYHHMTARTGLRVPVTYIARKGVANTFVLHLGIDEPSPAHVLTALGIDPDIWRKKRPKRFKTPEFDAYLMADIFSRKPLGILYSETPPLIEGGQE